MAWQAGGKLVSSTYISLVAIPIQLYMLLVIYSYTLIVHMYIFLSSYGRMYDTGKQPIDVYMDRTSYNYG